MLTVKDVEEALAKLVKEGVVLRIGCFRLRFFRFTVKDVAVLIPILQAELAYP